MSRRLSLSSIKTELVFPGSLTKYSIEGLGRFYEGASILQFTTRTGAHVGLLVAEVAAPLPLSPACEEDPWYLLFCYGNGMCLATCGEVVAFFQQMGLSVLIPEYLGYGMSSDEASEAGCYASADAAYSYLTETRMVPPTQILVGGWSLGAAVAIDLACRQPVAGLVALSPFTTLLEEARSVLPWLPQAVVRGLVQERFDNLAKIRQVPCPILIAHGTHDELVPFAMAERLAHAAHVSHSVTLLPLEGCYHNDLFVCGRGALRQGLAALLIQVQQARAAPGSPSRN